LNNIDDVIILEMFEIEIENWINEWVEIYAYDMIFLKYWLRWSKSRHNIFKKENT